MSLYESNFIRLRQLIDDMENLDGAHCSVVEQDRLPLHLEVLELTRYTATLQLTYLLPEQRCKPLLGQAGDAANIDQWLADPAVLRLRVYFDGRLAEAMSLTW